MGQANVLRRVFGAVLACVLLLPVPVFAYTIGPWSFFNSGLNLYQGGNTNTVNYGSTSGNVVGGPSYSGTGFASLTNVTPGESLSAAVNLTGLIIPTGTLTVTVVVNTSSGSESTSHVFSGDVTSSVNLSPLTLDSGSTAILLLFQYSSDASVATTPTTPFNVQFGS